MPYHATVRSERFTFADLRDLFAKANEEKSGDQLAGIAAATERERVAAKLALADVTLGEYGGFAVRVQPNHPNDDVPGILLAALDGLLFGCGDAVIGVNPAAESVDTVAAILRNLDRLITTLGIPTQACCLAHISTQL